MTYISSCSGWSLRVGLFGAVGFALLLSMVGLTACTKPNPKWCDENRPCPSGKQCNLKENLCELASSPDAGMLGTVGSDFTSIQLLSGAGKSRGGRYTLHSRVGDPPPVRRSSGGSLTLESTLTYQNGQSPSSTAARGSLSKSQGEKQ